MHCTGAIFQPYDGGIRDNGEIRMTVILGAIDGEISAFLGAMTHRRDQRMRSFRYHQGEIDDTPVVVARSGVGKTLSAATTQHLIDRFSPKRIIFTGIAGSLKPQLQVGDILVAADCLQYDLDAGALGFQRGEVPYAGFRVLTCDPELRRAAESFRPERGRLHVGRVLTGDRFVTDADEPQWQSVWSELAGDAVEMEGASVALVAAWNSVPFQLVRTISDRATGIDGINIRNFLRETSENSLACVRHMLASLSVAH
ncbi:MAG: 5'-methylthioadenosine/adenosylhomocysteine nucleosidase [Spirochaetaceae bacterium]|nr:MAG: 5'-methylthioadenosine/adenosylhomocysteine nucleosidase [Spirochaetaceae bacterium]